MNEEERAFLQERLVRFTRLWLVMLPIFVICVLGFHQLYPELQQGGAVVVDVVTAVVLLPMAVGFHVALRRRRLTARQLHALDATGVIVIGAAFGLSTYVSAQLLQNTFFIWHTFVIFTRAITVPSSARRTAVVTGVSFMPILAVGLIVAEVRPEFVLLPLPAYVIGGAIYAGTAVALATVGSRVIYGLRREVREARQLGQYTLDTKLGEGGMGAVYRAHHAMLRRPTAIKLLPPSLSNAEAVARFEREVQHTSRLTHPSTVAIFDYGRSLGGVFYYAMEYVDGIDLETLVQRHGAQPAARVIHVLRQVAGALEEAHRKGLIHRDIKPANILLCQRDGQHDLAKVVDFGLVRRIDEAAEHARIVGTPAFLSPEAITAPDRVGPRSDLYALGAVGYVLVTGVRVFDGTPLELCGHHVRTAPEPPSARTDRPIPPALEQLILACLAKAPSARPDDARALGDALATLAAAHPWTEADAAAWWRDFTPGPTPSVSTTAVTMSVDVAAR